MGSRTELHNPKDGLTPENTYSHNWWFLENDSEIIHKFANCNSEYRYEGISLEQFSVYFFDLYGKHCRRSMT